MLASESRYSDIVRSAMDAIVIFDDDGQVRAFNGAAERMFRCPSGDAVGRPVSRFFAEEVSARRVQELCLAPRADQMETSTVTETNGRVMAFTATRATGESFPVEASVSCLDTVDGHRYTLIARDVSERKQQEEALREQALSLANTSAELKALNDELELRQADLERAMTA